jgi:CubicO group peptidase (beta-lactamase class C family)
VPTTDHRLCELAREIAEELDIAGAQISVIQDGVINEGVAGITSIESGLEVTPETLFQIGSTTKVFTAALVLELAAEGRIDIDTPVVDQLPEFVLADQSALNVVTPRHLMSMSSGIDNGSYIDYGPCDDALAKYVAALADEPHVFPPGEGFGYSNASTNVSGRLVEYVTGQTWETALRTKLLEPAGLADSATATEDIIPRRFALGHKVGKDGLEQLRKWALPRSMGPAGGTLCSTATDLVRFAALFLRAGMSLNGNQVLAPETVERMQTREVQVPPTLLAEWWGLGPYGKVWDGAEIWGHSGTNMSGSSYLLWARDHNLAIATTVNTPAAGYPFAARAFRELFRDLAGISVPSPPVPPAHVELDVERFVGAYAMHGLDLRVRADNGGITISGRSQMPGVEWEIEDSLLIPLSPTTFLPTNPVIDGSRGWALAFTGSDDRPATHLVNGFFALRRVSGV